MAEEYRIACTDNPEDADFTVIGLGIRSFNEQQAGVDGHRRLCLFLHSPDDTVVGGLIGSTYFNWLHVDLLGATERLRGRGHGRRLLMLAEGEAQKRRAKGACLDTFSFQAPGFYRKNGYEVFGVLQDFPERHQRYFFRKQL
jgi:GNAT superfamily N-acetyltransferase